MKKLQWTALILCIAGASLVAGGLVRDYYNMRTAPGPEKYFSIVRLVRENHTFCSGTVVANNLIITAAHCVLIETPIGMMLNPEEIDIRPNTNVNVGATATVVYASPQMDQAMLTGDFTEFNHRKIITDPATLTKLGKSNKKFVSCGYPLNGDLYCNDMEFKDRNDFFWAVNGILIPGMSGGPIMLPNGDMVGVNVAVEKNNSIVSPIYNILNNLPKVEEK
jgi:hypothetical protein